MKDEVYSIRLDGQLKSELKSWADQNDRPLAWLVVRILESALQERIAATSESNSPASALPRRPMLEAQNAFRAENAS